MKNLCLFNKVDAPWVLEVITERFDFLPIDCMTDSAVVYGGAIRDALAGIELKGDLDIATDHKSFNEIVQAINSSPRWERVEQKVSLFPRLDKPGYGKHVPLDQIVRFQNMHGAEIEVILAKEKGEENSMLTIPAKVDIVCCGLAMDRSGHIYEIVEGAHKDCLDRILRLNEAIKNNVDIDRMTERIKKLVGRGWTSKIDLGTIRKHQKNIQRKSTKTPKSKKRPDAAERVPDEYTTILSHFLKDLAYGMMDIKDGINKKIRLPYGAQIENVRNTSNGLSIFTLRYPNGKRQSIAIHTPASLKGFEMYGKPTESAPKIAERYPSQTEEETEAKWANFTSSNTHYYKHFETHEEAPDKPVLKSRGVKTAKKVVRNVSAVNRSMEYEEKVSRMRRQYERKNNQEAEKFFNGKWEGE